MATLVHAEIDDEIADLIAKIGAAGDANVGVIVPPGSRALQTPLNARLLSQFGNQRGRTLAIVSDEPRVQELARQQGLAVYPSVTSFRHGLEMGGPSPQAAVGPAAAGTGLLAAAGNGTGAPPAARATPPPPPAAGAAPALAAAGATIPPVASTRSSAVLGPMPPAHSRRRLLYAACAALGLIGLLLFFTLAPTATITVTVAATPLSVSPTIQGSTDATAAKQGDHILTSVVDASASGRFTATPSGSATLPATAATATIVFSTNIPSGAQFQLNQGDEFQTADRSITFLVTQSTYICISPQGSPPPSAGQCGGGHPNADATVQDATPEAKGNVPANSITNWDPPSNPDPCTNNPLCQGPGGHTDDITLTNPQAATGGADSRQVTVAGQSDVTGWTTQVSQIENQLTSQVNASLQSKAGNGQFAVDPGGNGKSIVFTVSPQLPSPGAQFSQAQISVTATAAAAVYNPADVRNDIVADLTAQLAQGDQLAPGKLTIQPCSVTQAGTDGTVVLSCSATDLAQPVVDIAGLKKQLSGRNPGDADRIIDAAIDNVQDVQVSEFPFKLFYLPLFSSRIEIDETFVTPSQSQSTGT